MCGTVHRTANVSVLEERLIAEYNLRTQAVKIVAPAESPRNRIVASLALSYLFGPPRLENEQKSEKPAQHIHKAD
jgi:hypothetical protein